MRSHKQFADNWLRRIRTCPGRIIQHGSGASTGVLQSVGTVADILDKGSGAVVLLDGEFDVTVFICFFFFHHPFNGSLS